MMRGKVKEPQECLIIVRADILWRADSQNIPEYFCYPQYPLALFTIMCPSCIQLKELSVHS